MTDAPAAPTTEAGRALIRDLQRIWPDEVARRILTIEAEARSTPAEPLGIERLTRVLSAIHGDNVPLPRPVPTSPREYAEQIVAMDARLALEAER